MIPRFLIGGLDTSIISKNESIMLLFCVKTLKNQYIKWASETNPNTNNTVVIPYVSAYGYTEEMARLIKEGIQSSGKFEVKLYNMETSDNEEVMNEIYWADGVLFGSPTMVSDILPPIMKLLTSMNPVVHSGKLVSAFGSYGWSGEAVPNIIGRLKQLRLKIFEDGLKINFKPSNEEIKEIIEFGKRYGEKLL